MLSTTSNTINTTLIYTDYSERTYKVPMKGEITQEKYQAAKDNIQAFNTAAQNDASSVSQTFLSDGGARVVRIKEAILIEHTEDVIFNG